jgi:mxaL protein
MRLPALKDPRTWLVAGALLLTLLAIFVPRIMLQRNAYDVMFVVDITTSMNTRDVKLAGEPASRLDVAKASIQDTLAKLPCGSKAGLGIFTERRTFVLFEPVEVCENFSALHDAIPHIHWRMGWQGDSFVSKGLFSALSIAHSDDADLIFITDGHELPPLPYSGLEPYEGKPGDVGGLVVGIGSHTSSRLLKYDGDGREVGVYAMQDIPQENRSGPPPPDAESRPGYHPKWAPFGNAIVNNKEHLAIVREEYLKKLAGVTGLTYAYLSDDRSLADEFIKAAHARSLERSVDVSIVPGSLALALLTLLYGIAAVSAFRSPVDTIHNST